MKTESINDYIECLNNHDFSKIIELKVNKFDSDNKILEVDLNELLYFPNLEVLTLFNMVLTYDDFKIINKLEKLHTLKLINCDLMDIIEDTITVKDLLLDNTLIETDKLTNINKLVLKNININLENFICNELDISCATITDINNIKANKIYIKNEQYLSFKKYFDSIKNTTKIIIKDEYDSQVGELK